MVRARPLSRQSLTGVSIENADGCASFFTPILTFPHQGGRDLEARIYRQGRGGASAGGCQPRPYGCSLACRHSLYGVDDLGGRHGGRLGLVAALDLHHALAQVARAYDKPQRQAEEVGVVELDPGGLRAIVV